mgnify:CR=1 FL=1
MINMKKHLTAREIYDKLLDEHIIDKPGKITFNLAGVSVTMNTTDTVGITLQSWLKQWMIDNDIYFHEPSNTQSFPDFYLDECETKNLLEVKAFNYEATPAFDIANYESYLESVSENAYRLNADYIIFGYTMDEDGTVKIKRIWLKKIWEIAGISQKWPLRVQDKRGMIYNIRPNSEFKKDQPVPFQNDEDFLNASYETHVKYKGVEEANKWLIKMIEDYTEWFNRKPKIPKDKN